MNNLHRRLDRLEHQAGVNRKRVTVILPDFDDDIPESPWHVKLNAGMCVEALYVPFTPEEIQQIKQQYAGFETYADFQREI
jgi:hypothetical protein